MDFICQHCRVTFSGPLSRKDQKKYCSNPCYWAGRRASRLQSVAAGHKTCPGCGETKLTEMFSRQKRSADGYEYRCKACRSAYELQRFHDPKLVPLRIRRYSEDARYRAASLLRSIRYRAKKRGLICNLTLDWLAERISGRCELTGLPFEYAVEKRSQPGARTPSVDRIEAGKGYTVENCRVICSALNSALGSWGIEGFLPIARALVNHQRADDIAA